jgi:hypothetical protein
MRFGGFQGSILDPDRECFHGAGGQSEKFSFPPAYGGAAVFARRLTFVLDKLTAKTSPVAAIRPAGLVLVSLKASCPQVAEVDVVSVTRSGPACDLAPRLLIAR